MGLKKIMYVVKSMAMLAGTERVVSTKINWLAEHGYKVCLVTYEQGHHPIVLPIHPEVKYLDLDVCFWGLHGLPLFQRFIKRIKMKSLIYVRLKQAIEDFRPDIILTTTYSLNIAEEVFKTRNGARLILESHDTCCSVIKEYAYLSHPLLKFVAKLYDKQNLKYANNFDRLITLTKGDADEWHKHLSLNIYVIPNPLRLIPVSSNKTKEFYFRIIAVGRLEIVKGFENLIKAFALIADQCLKWRLDIFGDGSCKDRLKALITYYKLESRISILPTTYNIIEEYKKSDFYVLSSQHEAFGMVLLEAMSCGIPCVSFDCDYGPREIINDGVNGLLVDNGNINKLAQSILWMTEHHKERLLMGERAKNSVKRYQTDNVMQSWVALFDSL